MHVGRSVAFEVAGRMALRGALGSLLRGALPLEWRSERVVEAAAAARLAVGGGDEDAMPVCAVVSREGFRFVYTFWKWKQSEMEPAPRHFLLALQEAAAALLATNVALPDAARRASDAAASRRASDASLSRHDSTDSGASVSSSLSAKDSPVRQSSKGDKKKTKKKLRLSIEK
jgi:hypothetical protein